MIRKENDLYYNMSVQIKQIILQRRKNLFKDEKYKNINYFLVRLFIIRVFYYSNKIRINNKFDSDKCSFLY